jgi:hypothetical protein
MAVRKSTAVARAEISPLTKMLVVWAKNENCGTSFESTLPPIMSIIGAVAATTGTARNERPGTLSA